MRRIIFSDLDGTILTHTLRSLAALNSTLVWLKEHECDVVWNSSKTAAEILFLTSELSVQFPFIVENGAAIYLTNDLQHSQALAHPSGLKHIRLGPDYTEIRKAFQQACSSLCINAAGYFDLSLEEISQRTGLSLEEASRAKARECSETILSSHSSDELGKLAAKLQEFGLILTQGTRFYTIGGRSVDKGMAASIFCSILAKSNQNFRSYAIGDAANDYSMIAVVNRGYILKPADSAEKSIAQWKEVVCKIASAGGD